MARVAPLARPWPEAASGSSVARGGLRLVRGPRRPPAHPARGARRRPWPGGPRSSRGLPVPWCRPMGWGPRPGRLPCVEGGRASRRYPRVLPAGRAARTKAGSAPVLRPSFTGEPSRARVKVSGMARYLFASHDGFGLGHVRRNTLVARAILAREPDAEIVVVTGLPMRPAWLGQGVRVVPVPALLKDSAGAYRNPGCRCSRRWPPAPPPSGPPSTQLRPDVVVVDRHPYGTAGELKAGLHSARQARAPPSCWACATSWTRPPRSRPSSPGAGWDGVPELFDEVLVYGERVLCDHEREYGLPVAPRYTGWVADSSGPAHRGSPGWSWSRRRRRRRRAGLRPRHPARGAGCRTGRSSSSPGRTRPGTSTGGGNLTVLRTRPAAPSCSRGPPAWCRWPATTHVRGARRRDCARCWCRAATRAASRPSGPPG